MFDQDKSLVLFNPKLLEMTGLKFPTLSAQPHLYSFLDQLRDVGSIPEPKNHKDWHAQIQKIEQDTLEDGYNAIWNLANQTTLRVTGRTHPDGAIVYLFEDISVEIRLTRKFNSDIQKLTNTIDM